MADKQPRLMLEDDGSAVDRVRTGVMGRRGSVLNLTSLREQVYQYFREEMQSGSLTPGSFINLNSVSRELGISKTPLRDALIQLEVEGFVSILPRRGILVNKLTRREIKNMYQVIGSLEASVVAAVFDRFTQAHIDRMKQLNAGQITALAKKDFDTYYKLNLEFHDVFLSLSDNETLKKIIRPLKQRLYDFPRRGYLEDWEKQHLSEHERFIAAIANEERQRAAEIIQNQHWSFDGHKKYLDRFYELGEVVTHEL
jgi:DNA-binding GntR family transcriptional regulator